VPVAIPRTTTETVTPTVPPTTTVEPTPTASATQTAEIPGGRAPFIAYRKSGAVWVSGEHGSDPRSVLGVASGPFALSPNGLSLAVADSVASSLTVVDLVSGSAARIGRAADVRPVWAPNSAWFMYSRLPLTGDRAQIVRVNADGTGETVLGRGQAFGVGPDSKTIVLATGIGAGKGPLLVIDAAGAQREIGKSLAIDSVAPANHGVYYAVTAGVNSAGNATSPYIGYIRYDGTSRRRFVDGPVSSQAAQLSDLMLSPDGRYLAYEESGDDGYSRIYLAKTAGGKLKLLSPRRDDYLLGWSADGREVIFAEGNTLNDEATKIMAVRVDGTLRRIVAAGGSL
jgi:hypothetical protein